MKFRFKNKIFAVHAVVLAVGVLLSALIYFHGRSVMDATEFLVERDLPALKSLSDLKTDVIELEPILYEYYISGSRERFLERLESNGQRIEANLSVAREAFPLSTTVAGIESRYAGIKSLARQLDQTLSAERIDRNKARELIAGISRSCGRIIQELDGMVRALQNRVSSRAQASHDKVYGIIGLVAFFSGMLFLVVLIAGHYVRAHLAGVEERKRLAMFPERNPNPVLSLAPDGAVLFANPGATEMLRKLGADPTHPAVLFPGDLAQRLARLESSSGEPEQWEHTVGERTLACRIHFLEDFRVFHAYLWDITERKQAEEKLNYQAYHDALTGLPNRYLFQARMVEALSRGRERTHPALMILNVDRLKQVNDSLGHVVGDRLLQAVVQRLQAMLQGCEEMCADSSLYRLEGDLFVILMPSTAVTGAPVRLAERIAAHMKESLRIDGREFFVTFSIGIAVYPSDGEDPVTLVKNADSTMHAVKRRGGNGYQCYTQEMNARALDALELGNALRHALERDELMLHYQPQLDIRSGRIVGVEALIRWRHPDRGMVSPAEFIPLAEESGLIAPIGEWVLRSACAQARKWQGTESAALTVAVNISARQFQSLDLPGMVERILAETGLPPGNLELEVTESVAMGDVEFTIAALRKLKEIGLKLSIDDFGTGYSSLSYLKRFPIDKLKVDQSFVRNLITDANDRAITEAIITLGHGLKLKVIAEGVETRGQLDLLCRYGCDEMQGYLFSRPLSGAEFAQLVIEDRRLNVASHAAA